MKIKYLYCSENFSCRGEKRNLYFKIKKATEYVDILEKNIRVKIFERETRQKKERRLFFLSF